MMKLTLEEIYFDKLSLKSSHTYTLDEIEERFLNTIYSHLQAMKIKSLDIYATSTNFQGFFSKKTELLVVEFKKSKIKNLYAVFLVQNHGVMFSFRLYKCIHTAYVKRVIEKPSAQRSELIKNLFQNFEERHDFSMFDTLMDQVFENALSSLKL